MIQTKRSSGVLMSITSLPSHFGIGDLGPSAFRFADVLAESRQSYWEVLPVTPTGPGHSPYNPASVFAGNTLMISPQVLEQEGLLEDYKNSHGQPQSNRANFIDAVPLKREMIRTAYRRFRELQQQQGEAGAAELEQFCSQNSVWLDDYVLYAALREELGEPWYLWPQELRDRDTGRLAEARLRLADVIERERFAQFQFFKQWRSLKRYCTNLGIGIVGDLSFYVGADSADTWSRRELFKLQEDGRPAFVSGVPPDYFSQTGQLWGDPVYDWDRLQAERFDWWVRRIRHNLELFDLARLDHFRGFVAYWEVPSTEKTAASGRWVPAPCEDFMQTLKRNFPAMPFIADDLGTITPDVREFMTRFGLPGMDVLVFAFDSDGDNPYLPKNHSPMSVVYTGTHDTNTVRGWFTDEAGQEQKRRLFEYLGGEVSEEQVSREFVQMALGSVAFLSIVPTQDILGLGSEARMNRPSIPEGNWAWTATSGQLTMEAFRGLAEATQRSGRAR
jgi:4-alpha-glucanotransferase